MLHPKRVTTTLYYAFRRRVRVALRIPARPQPPPVLGASMEYILKAHSSILDSLGKYVPPGLDLTGKNVCEVGAGDCLASSAYFLAKGSRHVDIIDVQLAVVNDKQAEVLASLKSRGYPIDLTIIQGKAAGQELYLDPQRITYHHCYMEDLQSSSRHDFIFSCSVLEHVENLAGFYAACWNTIKSGGYMLHFIDLGGHGFFEDPLPPLDFQTYPDWLYNAMSPKYNRATRRFLSEHIDAVKSAGFAVERTTPTREVDDEYLDQLWPKLRRSACERPREEIRVVEFALLARKP